MKFLLPIVFFPLTLVRFILIFMLTFLFALVGLAGLKLFGFSRKLQYGLMKWWGKSLIFVLGVRIERNELPKISHFILMPNHRSYLDIFIVAQLTPVAFVAKAELRKWPVLGTAAKLTNTIFVSRNEMKSLIKTMQDIKRTVSNQIPVAVFPEGTTYKGPLTKTFKNGSFKIAAETGIPIVPMAIHFYDEEDAWVGDDTFIGHFFRQMYKPFTRAAIRYGKPVQGDDYKKLKEETRQQIDQMLQDIMAPSETFPASEPVENRNS